MNLPGKLKHFFSNATVRLAGSYLAIIMIMSVGFSAVFYNASSRELSRPVQPLNSSPGQKLDIYIDGDKVHAYLEQRAAEGRHALLTHLILLNVAALAGGAALSYYLARRTLQPIEANMEAQNQFVSDAAHELRTPLTALQTVNEVGLRRPKLTDRAAKEILATNVEEVVKLRSLTDSLLKLAVAGQAEPALARVSLPDLVADAINAVIPQAQAKNINIEDQVPALSIEIDRSSIAQALTTILDNAIKYSPANTVVTVTAAAQGKHVSISVTDQGIGIPALHLPHIFDRFYRADQARNKQETDGFGIGLSLAKKIIEQHGGEINVSSRAGKGSTFIVRLPAN